MIILRFTSGLGNQMFQYGMYLYLKKKYPLERVKADVSWYSWNSAHQGFELEKLFSREDNPCFHLDKATEFEAYCCSGELPRGNLLNRLVNRATRFFAGRHFEAIRLSETGRESCDVLKEKADHIPAGRNTYITGYFVRESYYGESLEELRQAFSFDLSALDCEGQRFLREIEESESVSIHVRRGDYLNPVYNGNFINLGMDYYRSAVDIIRKKFSNPRFFLFSDDKEYVKAAFGWLTDSVIVTGNDGDKSYLDMALMSRCRANITANSTFSEWAGLLNDRADAIVIYPKAYLKDKDSEEKTLPNWLRL